MHLPGAMTPKMVHPAICSCVTPYIYKPISKLGNARTQGAQVFKINAPGIQYAHTLFHKYSTHLENIHEQICQNNMCTQGAGCTFNQLFQTLMYVVIICDCFFLQASSPTSHHLPGTITQWTLNSTPTTIVRS